MPAHRIVAASLVVVLAGCQQSEQPQRAVSKVESPTAEDQVSDAVRQKAVAAKDALFTRLSDRLVDVMGKDGPAAAIVVCSREASTMAADVGKEHDVAIGRTSFQLRNPNNAPPEWAQAFVENRTVAPVFVALPNDRSGALLPIKLKKKCLTCHGPADTIAPDVQSKLAEFYPNDNATGFSEGDLRGWFWVEVPAPVQAATDEGTVATEDHSSHAGGGPGMGRGRGMMRRGHGGGMREDMTTLHAMFADRDKIKRAVRNLPNGAEATTESDDEEIASLIQEHVPAMEGRVMENNPLPPMTFHPIFVALIKHSDDYTLTYEDTDQGVKVNYQSDDPYVVMLVQEHAKLVSRFIKNGMEEIHKPYTLPKPEKAESPSAALAPSHDTTWQVLPKEVDSPADNPTTAAKVELGKKLFFDPRLSLTGTVSCNSCHNLMEGGDDGRPTSMGIHGRLGPRNANTVWNSVFQASQFWDGRSPSLEDQAKGPIVAVPEMGMPTHDMAIERIIAIPGYRAEFRKVFDSEEPVTIDNAVKAIAAFERTLITPNSPYDRSVSGDKSAMSEKQVRGMKLFASVGCTECHSGPAFNGWEVGSTTPTFEEFPRIPSSRFVKQYGLDADLGRFNATKNEADKHHFKVPTLRNITITAPYLHNGAVPTLSETVRLMGETELDTELSDADVSSIVAFLAALEGEFPDITLPRLPSRPNESVLEDQEPAAVAGD